MTDSTPRVTDATKLLIDSAPPVRAHSTLAEVEAAVAPGTPAYDLPDALLRRRGYDID